ncbi:MAG TPA: 2,3-bisphosphoglycerate-independent phosphoglycerate mutase [Methylomirabilota bacterium]|nr:2,3-bisphosphoglycerate-independent phosphoglycerate mutase [Methylomirabilota bacterium]
MDLGLLHDLAQPNTTKIILCSLDGLGGLPRPGTGKSELETARLPNLHALAKRSACGLLRHVGPGITPGSGPGHLGLFGYDPLQHPVGRGVLEALGIDFHLKPGDVAARGNFCTVDAQGRITDRRAGRIATELCVALCEKLRSVTVDGAEIVIEPLNEHRFVLVLRGEGLSGRVSETDPQALGAPPLRARALEPSAERAAAAVNQFVERARPLLRDAAPANMVLLRGFDKQPDIPLFPGTFRLRAAAVAAYPMYRGLARLVGMDVLDTGPTFADEIATLKRHWNNFDFFFLHYKDTDKAGEDGDFDAKVAALERFDARLPDVQALGPDVLAVSGDHSTPSILAAHGWQPVPALVSSAYCGADHVSRFTERDCAGGALGILPAQDLMPLLMANGLRLAKYGA